MKKCLLALGLLFWLTATTDAQAQRRKKKTAEPAPQESAVTPTNADTTAPVTPAATFPTDPFSVQQRVFGLAIRYSDGETAKQALYNMLAMRPQSPNLLDSLALLYFDLGDYAECVLVTRDIVRLKPNDPTVLLIKATAEKNIGLLSEALASYEKLYLRSQDIYHLYEMALLQFKLQRYKEAAVSVDLLLENPATAEAKVAIGTNTEAQQEVPMRASAHNLRGVLAEVEKDRARARASYQEALQLAPDFQLAKDNLKQLK